MPLYPPPVVLALAAKAKGNPIAWREIPTGWVIVFEDGRKLTFDAPAIAKVLPPPSPAAVKPIRAGPPPTHTRPKSKGAKP